MQPNDTPRDGLAHPAPARAREGAEEPTDAPDVCPKCGGGWACWCQNACETCGEPTYNGTFQCMACGGPADYRAFLASLNEPAPGYDDDPTGDGYAEYVVDTLRQQVADLTRDLAAARADAARLDWLEQTAGRNLLFSEHTRYVNVSFDVREGLRSVVDELMAQEGA